jgi:outer membrane protein TolC
MKKMKIKAIIGAILFISLNNHSPAQTHEEPLKAIEKNNLQLQAARKLKEQRSLKAHTGIYPMPLSVNYGYFPDNNTVVDKKQTLNITQTIHWPGAYGDMKKLAGSRAELAELYYEKQRQDVLYKAQKQLIQLIFNKKRLERLDKRVQDAEQRVKATEKKVEAGDANVLEANKSKFHLLRMERAFNKIRIEHDEIKQQLTKLNGGKKLETGNLEYPVFRELNLDSLIAEKEEKSPAIKIADQNKAQSKSMVEVERSLNLPNLTFGYGSETVGNSSFKGMLVGFNIPLWSNKNKVKAAKANAQQAEIVKQNKLLDIESKTKKQYQTYVSLKENLKKYKATLDDIQNTKLLKKSVELGKISIIEYFRELQYYYEIYDEYLQLEKEYYLVQSRMYKHKL